LGFETQSSLQKHPQLKALGKKPLYFLNHKPDSLFITLIYYSKCFVSDEGLQTKKDFLKEVNRSTGFGNLTLLLKKSEYL
jgi:hypothetical protein